MTDHLPAALRALWHELPLLAAAGVLVCTASGVVVLLMPGLSPGSVLLSALLVGPVWAGLVATTDSVVRDGPGGVLLMLRSVRRCGPAGLEVAAVPAIIGALALLNWTLYSGPLFLLPMAVSGCATVLAVLAACYAFSLRVTTGMRGRSLWFTSLALVARAPVVPLGIVALGVVALMLGTSVTASLLLLAPGPVALFASAGTWTVYRTENHALQR
ncbi:hypothetical protein E1218_06290 [Kribbella turkmenica]|uniref:DUF624 domain-containing protein n=1 Tax=Kribbella turkmenica TaxID=2530375 RepID=A0A4R4XD83_9ACTN|nr:hypothetical protein [Kribbella turkmenica]TDD28721.1 hypothetical protein E1218_06290 [Kribbella turkmenica]